MSAFKLNPAHKGFCSPMTKKTCTGKRRTFALNAKHHFKKWKKEDGGGLEQTNDPTYNAFSQVLMNRNRDKNFVDRAYHSENYPIINNPDGSYSTHRMAYSPNDNGTGRVYPTIIQNADGTLTHMNEGDQSWDYADSTGQYIQTPSWKMADYLSNRGYKNAVKMSKRKGGKMCDEGAKLSTQQFIPMAYGGMTFAPEQTYTSPWMQRGFSQGYGMQNNGQMNEMPPLPLASHQMSTPGIQPYTPQPVDGPTQEQTSIRPPVKHPSISTPGSGNMIAGVLGIANSLVGAPPQANQYKQRQYGNYNPNSMGTDSQMLYEDGGKFPGGTHTNTRQVGGFKVQEEIPNNLGYGNTESYSNTPVQTSYFNTRTPAPLATAPIAAVPAQYNSPTPAVQHISPFQMPRSVNYEHLVAPQGREVLAPRFDGNWSPSDIKGYWNNIPSSIGGKEVLRGQVYNDVRKRFKNGGKLSVGQQIHLTDEQLRFYESQGYKFQ